MNFGVGLGFWVHVYVQPAYCTFINNIKLFACVVHESLSISHHPFSMVDVYMNLICDMFWYRSTYIVDNIKYKYSFWTIHLDVQLT